LVFNRNKVPVNVVLTGRYGTIRLAEANYRFRKELLGLNRQRVKTFLKKKC
jgi:hypothetical protein